MVLMAILKSAYNTVTTDIVKPMNVFEVLLSAGAGLVGYAIVGGLAGMGINKITNNETVVTGGKMVASVATGLIAGKVLGGSTGTIIQNGLVLAPMGSLADIVNRKIAETAISYLPKAPAAKEGGK